MAHGLILGMTESGKSSLLKQIIASVKDKGIHTIVLDPLCDPSFGADFQTADPAEFEYMWKNSRGCVCGIDESGTVGKFSDSIREAATKGRHWGHSFFFLAQKATQVEPLVRDQTSNLYLFRSGLQSRKILAEEYDCDTLTESVEMLEYHYCSRSKYHGKYKINFGG